MAGGKENARQKMINLMYLVFIAMLALNMSKEVLMTFGEIDREVVKSTKSLKESNKAAIQVIKNSAKNDSLQWYTAYQPISKISEAANELTEFINKNDKRPNKHSKNKDEKTLVSWISHQIKNYQKKINIMKEKEIYDSWTEFINDEKYKKYLMSNFKIFNLIFNEISRI